MKNRVNKIYERVFKFSSAGLILLASSYSVSTFAADYPEAGNFSDGSKVWAENCNRCHNMRGPKELRDDQWISTAYHMRIRAGLTGQEMRDVITFLQASNTKTVAAGSTLVVAKLSKGVTGHDTYEKTCIACHAADGKGAFPGTPNFTDSSGVLSKSDDVLINNITNGFQSPGSPMAMPPKGGNPSMTATDIEAVLKYIRETFGK
jgi:cytochrome c5